MHIYKWEKTDCTDLFNLIRWMHIRTFLLDFDAVIIEEHYSVGLVTGGIML